MNVNQITAVIACDYCPATHTMTRGEKWTTPGNAVDLDEWVADSAPIGWHDRPDGSTVCPSHPRAMTP